MESSSNDTIKIYKSLKGNKYIQKTHVLDLLKDTFLREFPFMNIEPVHSRFMTLLSEKENGLENTCDFIPWLEISPIVSEMVDVVSKSLGKAIMETGKSLSAKATGNIVMEGVQEVMASRPEIFTSKVSDKFPRTVRLFSEDKKRFVIAEELERALNIIPHNKETVVWNTMDFAIGIRMANASEHNIEFLIHEIDRAHPSDLTESRIRSPNGTMCRLAVDVLFEFILFFAFDKEPIYNTLNMHSEANVKLLRLMNQYFRNEENLPYFMNEDFIEVLKREYNILTEGIPIAKKSSTEYQLYKEAKRNEVVFRIGVITHYLSTTPNLSTFVHNQKACYRLLAKNCCGVNMVLEKEVSSSPEVTSPEVTSSEATSSEVHTDDSEEAQVDVQNKKKNKRRKKKAAKSEIVEEPETQEEVLEALPHLLESEKLIEPKESSTCQKCYRTSVRCNEAKEKLKESENLNKKLKKELDELKMKFDKMMLKEVEKSEKKWEEKQAETEKELEELKRKFAAYQEETVQKLETKDEEILGLKVELEAGEKEKDQMVEENVELKQKLVLVIAAPGPVQEEEELPIDFEKMLDDLQDKYLKLNEADPFGDAVRKVRKLKGLTEDEQVQMFAESELDKFQEHYLEYTSALEGNMNAIQTDNFSSVIPLPDYPKLSEEFEQVLGKAQEKRNKELELECVICTVEMDLEKKEELFKCPGCKKFTHLHCIETWFKKSPNCPHCRATWN